MNNLALPSYIINVPFLNAIRRDNVTYVEGNLKNHPCMRTALFYSIDENSTISVFDGILRPPVILLLTTFGYALLFGSINILKILLKSPETCELTCFAADCLDLEKNWSKHYRLIEFPPLTIRKPSASLYSPLMDSTFDFDAKQIINCRIFQGGNEKLMASHFESAWELFWSIYNNMRNIPVLIDITSELLMSGCDVKKLIKRVNLEKLLRQCKQSRTSFSDSVCFLHVLIFHGVDFENEHSLKNFLNVLIYMCSLNSPDIESLNSVFFAIFNLSNGAKEFQHVINDIRMALKQKAPPTAEQQSLQLVCVRKIRSNFCAPRFFRTIAKMKMSKECKYLLLTGLPEGKHEGGNSAMHDTFVLMKRSISGI